MQQQRQYKFNEETRRKMSESAKNKIVSKESIEKGKLSRKNFVYWNNGITNTQASECPGPEWKRGRLVTWKRKPASSETKKNISNSLKNKVTYYCSVCNKSIAKSEFAEHCRIIHNYSDEDILNSIGISKTYCPTCGKENIPQIKYFSYSNYCSKYCRMNDPKRLEKVKQTWSRKSKEELIKIKEKQKNVDWNKRNEKRKLTYQNMSEERKAEICSKRQNTVDNYSKEWKQQYKAKVAEGLRQAWQNKTQDWKDARSNKIKQSLAMLTPERNAERFKKSGDSARNTSYNKISQYVISSELLTPREKYNGPNYNDLLLWRCKKCGEEFKHWYYSEDVSCPKCFPPQISKPQKEILYFIQTFYQGEILENTKKIIPPKELDIYIPEHKLAIEFNGVYWHARKDGPTYHYDKFKACGEQGIRLIQVWEHKWNDPVKRAVVENIIKGAMNEVQTIYARKCKVRIHANPAELKDFFEKNNIEGYRGGKVAYSLVDDNEEILMAFIFGHPYHNKNYQWEVIRGAQKQGIRVIGGSSKLWKAFRNYYNPKNCIYYTMNDYYNGNSIPHLDNENPWKFERVQSSFMNYSIKENKMKARDPKNHKEIVQGYKDGSIIQVFNSGNKVWTWHKQ